MQLLTILLLAALVEQASAHGYVNQIAVDGKWYAGNKPGSNPQGIPIRLISDGGPLQLQSSDAVDFVCGKNATKAPLVVPANANSRIAFNWVGMDGVSAWIHHVGPLITYMASCGSVTCDYFEPTVDTKWFKVAQLGQLPNDTSRWFQEAISVSKATYIFQLPDGLASGGYLVRHELISLQNAVSPNGIEFYPMCMQIHVDSDGQKEPESAVAFPASYNSSADGLIFDTYTPPVPSYTFPGGPLSNLPASGQGLGPEAPPPPAFPTSTQKQLAASGSSSPSPEQNSPTASGPCTTPTSPSQPRCLTKRKPGLRYRAAHFVQHAGFRGTR
ncbi:glycosyl hydrolase family 61-domain-containing protein [Irpex lacteus]|nr:glycosyl hydrolase family 61-domain-containing protein [Irpex lacteus]